jgi:hypothetical protein
LLFAVTLLCWLKVNVTLELFVKEASLGATRVTVSGLAAAKEDPTKTNNRANTGNMGTFIGLKTPDTFKKLSRRQVVPHGIGPSIYRPAMADLDSHAWERIRVLLQRDYARQVLAAEVFDERLAGQAHVAEILLVYAKLLQRRYGVAAAEQ